MIPRCEKCDWQMVWTDKGLFCPNCEAVKTLEEKVQFPGPAQLKKLDDYLPLDYSPDQFGGSDF